MIRPNTLRRSAVAGALAATAAVGLAACGSSSDSSSSASGATGSSSAALPKPSIMLEFPANASQIYFFSGLTRGTFKKDGVDPQVKLPDDGATPIKALAAGKVDFALQLSTGSVVAKGLGADVKVIGTLEVLPEGLMVLPSKVKTFADIKGQKVGIADESWEQQCMTRALKANGLSRSDVTFVNPGVNLVTPLLQGKLAGVNGSQYEQAIALIATGKQTKVFRFDQYCPQTSIQIVTSSKEIKEHPDTVKAMLKGISDSLAWAMQNEQAATDLYTKRYPEQDAKSNFAQWEASVPTFCTADSESKGLLYANPTQYQQLIDLTVAAGDLKKSYPVSDLVDDSYLPSGTANNASACANDRYKVDPMSQITVK